MDDQHQIIIPSYYCVSGYKNDSNNTNTKLFYIFCIMFSMMGKKFSRQHLKYFSYFYQKTVFDISCKLSPNLKTRFDISCRQFTRNIKPVFRGNKNVINLLSAAFAHRVVKVR